MDKFDAQTLASLQKEGIDPRLLRERPITGLPTNTAGIADLVAYTDPGLAGTNTRGYVVADSRTAQLPQNRAAKGVIFASPNAGLDTFAHEAEHLMAKKQLGHPALINEKFDELVKNSDARSKFVLDAMNVAPYLKQKYGISSGYFDRQQLKINPPEVLLYEQLASLAAAEYVLGVDLTKDPQLRKTLFKDRDVRETYNAITGLRQTRLDPRDLPPYTRQPEKSKIESLLEKARKSLRFAQGGETKLI